LRSNHLLAKMAEPLRRAEYYYCLRLGAHLDQINTRYGPVAIGFGLLLPVPQNRRAAGDCRRIGGQAAMAIGAIDGYGSLAGWNFCP
jgi:hypothetical protein